MKDKLIRELEAQKTEDPNYIGELTERAAQEILRLRAEVVRIHSDRQYIIGFNDGFDAAVERSQPHRLQIVEPHQGGSSMSKVATFKAMVRDGIEAELDNLEVLTGKPRFEIMKMATDVLQSARKAQSKERTEK